jgi:hypothetical protein
MKGLVKMRIRGTCVLYRVRHPEPPMLISDGITFTSQRAGTFYPSQNSAEFSCLATDKYVMVI